jgi:hypothetical protein
LDLSTSSIFRGDTFEKVELRGQLVTGMVSDPSTAPRRNFLGVLKLVLATCRLSKKVGILTSSQGLSIPSDDIDKRLSNPAFSALIE